MATLPQPRFYVYVLARPNGKPFYVGKGVDARVYDHEREARSGHNCHKCNVIRKIWRNGGEVQRYTVFMTDSEQEAFDYEVATIAMYGLETLCNQTVGGDGGAKGVVYSAEQRAAMSERGKKLAADPEWRRGVGERSKAAWAAKSEAQRQQEAENTRQRYADPEYREKHAEAVRRATSTAEYRQKLREAHLRRYEDPEELQKQRERASAMHTPEAVQKRAAGLRKSWQDPEVRRRRSEAQRRAQGTDEARQRRAAITRRRYENPEERKKTSEANHRRFADPEERRRTADAMARHFGYRYILRGPDGNEHITNNLQRFAIEYGLNPSHLRRVTIGDLPAHKGWTGRREKHKP